MIRFTGTRKVHEGLDDSNYLLSGAMLNPSAPLGGLYAPNDIPLINNDELKKMSKMSYVDLVKHIFCRFDFDKDDSYEFLDKALDRYKNFDDPFNPCPVHKLNKFLFVHELWHGPTGAFKDKALQIFPPLVSGLAEKYGKKYLYVTTTSGDTGPAALAGFKDLPNTLVIVFYPIEGTSRIQAEQMRKAAGKNVLVIGVHCDFDTLQSNMKVMLKSPKTNKSINNSGYELSTANSVNFGRIIFQIVYHFWSYFELVQNNEIKIGDKVTYFVPTGNLGDALGAFYTKMMGLPIGKIVLCSNDNNVLYDFVKKGIYDLRTRSLIKTTSPAMDILISSNIERILFHMFGSKRAYELMQALEKDKYFRLKGYEMDQIQTIFGSYFATQTQVASKIKSLHESSNYLMDTHTSTAYAAYEYMNYRSDILTKKSIIVSTASWAKFPEIMAEIFGCDSDFDSLKAKLGVDVPTWVTELEKMPEIHDKVINPEDMLEQVLGFIK